jgi:hypothetical protein
MAFSRAQREEAAARLLMAPGTGDGGSWRRSSSAVLSNGGIWHGGDADMVARPHGGGTHGGARAEEKNDGWLAPAMDNEIGLEIGPRRWTRGSGLWAVPYGERRDGSEVAMEEEGCDGELTDGA